MNLKVDAGNYVLAVSGGVDSMVLLDVLSKQDDLSLVVAHFDHGIRPDSHNDEALIKRVADNKGLKVEIGRGNLGAAASEDMARRARYEFLNKVKNNHQAKAIITAHQQDDLIETAFLNLIRGTNRQGLTAIDNVIILRPMLVVPKKEILEYAVQNQIEWIEDSTNKEDTYLRNYLRHHILNNLRSKDRKLMLKNLEKVAYLNNKLNNEIATLSHLIDTDFEIDREKFALLPSEVAGEVMSYWLREHQVKDFDKKTVQRLSVALKTGRAGSRVAVKAGFWLKMEQKKAHFTTSG